MEVDDSSLLLAWKNKNLIVEYTNKNYKYLNHNKFN